MIWISLLVLYGLIKNCDGCAPFDIEWDPWGPCSYSCGGGRRHRTGESCSWGIDKSDDGDCNQFCYNGGTFQSGRCWCPPWRTGRCCSSCRHIDIANCKPGQKECGGSPDNIRCTDCEDPYYSAGYGNGCVECPSITNCKERHCTRPENAVCLKCYDDNVFFLRTHSDTQCDRMCAWNNHYCWPGTCSDKLTTSCRCASGFHAVKHSDETSCQLDSFNTPSIEKCDTSVTGPNGEMKRASSTSSSTACSYLADFYGNFQPGRLNYALFTEFTVDVRSYTKPEFIHESRVGVTDVRLRVEVQPITGSNTYIKSHAIFTGKLDSSDVTSTNADTSSISLGTGSHTLSDGQWLCVIYEANGGGFLRSIDLTKDHRVPSAPVPYKKTKVTRRLCYRYDNAPPNHCKVDHSCSFEPLQMSEIITNDPLLTVTFPGWTDPIPSDGNTTHASGIELYQLTVREIAADKQRLKVDTRVIDTKTVQSSARSLSVNLHVASDSPKLYAIYLEVKDVADNVRQTRRFVLFDNSSHIDTRPDKAFFIESASSQTNYTWQTHHNDICLNWTDHFYNKFYLDNPLLNPIEPDPSGLINDVYEQRTGLLPVNGTPNVYGIVEFRTSWSLNDGSPSSEFKITDLQSQHYCNNFNVADGQTYTINIRAVDIASNSYIENRTVHIDRSVPHINNIWLAQGGIHRLFVLNRVYLSTMQLYFEALDPHSGIKEVEWTFGSSDPGSEVLTGYKTTNTPEKGCPHGSLENHKCYCPEIGKCEFYQYLLQMNKLMAVDKYAGDNNKTYLFTIKATNHAMLSNIEHLDIVVFGSSLTDGVTKKDKTSSVNTLVIAGSAVGGIVVLLIVVLLTMLIVKMHKRRLEETRRQQNGADHSKESKSNTYEDLKMTDLSCSNAVYDVVGQVSENTGDEPSTGPEYVNVCLKYNNI